MSWIEIIAPNISNDEELSTAYTFCRTTKGTVDKVMQIHSLKPQTMVGHYALYKSILHDNQASLPLSLLEACGTYICLLNKCKYSYMHHAYNFYKLCNIEVNEALSDYLSRKYDVFIKDNSAFISIVANQFDYNINTIFNYLQKLTLSVGDISYDDVSILKKDFNDKEILEINQVCCYFNYVHRLLNGLGVDYSDDKIGFY